MTTTHANTPSGALVRALGRPTLVALAALSVLVAAWVALSTAWSTASTLSPITRIPVYVMDPPMVVHRPALGENATAEFTQAQVITNADVSHAKTLLALGGLLPSVLVVLACLVVAVLAVRLLRTRPFGGVLTSSLATLGVLALVTAWAAPALYRAAQLAVVEAAGLNVFPDGQAEGYSVLVLPVMVRWDLAAIGAISLLFTVLVRRARRYQTDAEGLV